MLQVVPRHQHSISRKHISPAALRVLYRLQEAGYSAFLVGGAVRDLLLGGHPKDFDVATSATPEQVKQLFHHCRLIGRRFRLAHVFFGREIIEVATFRAASDDGSGDRAIEDGRLVRDNVYGTIEEDAKRRDFTCNALYYTVADFSVRDYVGGLADLNARVMKLIGHPEQRYREDPVRMLRAIRLAAKLGLAIDAQTAAPIRPMAQLVATAAPARLFEEVLKLFLYGNALVSFEGLEHYGLFDVLFPDCARALTHNRNGALRTMLRAGLQNTDRRIANQEPVSPAFLFALLLWPAFCQSVVALQRQGMHDEEAQRRAADRGTLHQSQRVALPRRFSAPMQDIWFLQNRLVAPQRKRVMRTVSHPRFRAAFDFLILRQAASASYHVHVDYWRRVQHECGQRAEQEAAEESAPITPMAVALPDHPSPHS